MEWDKLREIIKARLKKVLSMFNSGGEDSRPAQNIDFFLATYPKAPPAPSQFAAVGLETGGLKLAPFAPQKPHPKSPIPPPVSYMSEEQARQMQEYVFNQLGDFEAYADLWYSYCKLTTPIGAHPSPFSGFVSFACNQTSTTRASGNI